MLNLLKKVCAIVDKWARFTDNTNGPQMTLCGPRRPGGIDSARERGDKRATQPRQPRFQTCLPITEAFTFEFSKLRYVYVSPKGDSHMKVRNWITVREFATRTGQTKDAVDKQIQRNTFKHPYDKVAESGVILIFAPQESKAKSQVNFPGTTCDLAENQ